VHTRRLKAYTLAAAKSQTLPSMPRLRVSLGLNSGSRSGQPACTVVIDPSGAALMQAVSNKLRLKKREAASAHLYVWSTGVRVDLAAADISGCVADGDLVVVGFGEPFAGKQPAAAAAGSDLRAWEARWEARSADLALVEWRDAVAMNRALGRLSTLLEHPAHRGRLVSHAQQRRLPSASYLGHNLYADTLRSFESLAAAAREAEAAASPAELAFLAGWAERGAPQVVVSYVSGATPTLAHELCHARYALLPPYRGAVDAAWARHEQLLCKWMADLGYHASRHADEFGAYLLTEPHAFWRGRVAPREAAELRAVLAAALGEPLDKTEGPFGVRPVSTQAEELLIPGSV